MTDETDGVERDDEAVIEAEVVEPAGEGVRRPSSPAGRVRWRWRPVAALFVVALLVWWGWPRIEGMLPAGWRGRLAAPAPDATGEGVARDAASSSDATRALAERLSVLETRLSAMADRTVPAPSGEATAVIERLDARLTTVEGALGDLAARQAALETALASLREDRGVAARRAFARTLAVHLAHLALRLDEGGPLAGELAGLRALAPAMAGTDRVVFERLIDELSPLAVTGLASREELATRLEDLLAALPAVPEKTARGAGQTPGASGGPLGGLWKWLRGRVRIERRSDPLSAAGAGDVGSSAGIGDPTRAAIRLALGALRAGDEARAHEALLTLAADAPREALAVRDALGARLKARAALIRALDRLGDAGGPNGTNRNNRDGTQP